MSTNDAEDISFADLNLPAPILRALSEIGYEKPSPIQRVTIPPLLEGRDVVGLAQTGTGKTAAFALPILADIDLSNNRPQALVLCPTRELAIQVAEAFQSYAAHLKGFHVLPVYGGQDMRGQLKALKRGAHVVVGTPGRLLDHLNRKSLDLGGIQSLVLDEADEMLRMGFIEDVETILAKTPPERRVALFSATMPTQIREVADQYLNKPEEIRIETKTATNENIEQFYWLVTGTNKLDALTRILEIEEFEGMIIFVRTKTTTAELADKLNARGFSAAALNGDMSQQVRTHTVEQLKNGQLDIIVATDVAARGLDVERITHVMNYDIPYDEEAYVHRIGRTGRAGRKGKAILFVAPRERRLLRSIEKTTRKPITPMVLPTRNDLIDSRSRSFKNAITEAMGRDDLAFFHDLVNQLCMENEATPQEVASALAYLLQKDRPLIPPVEKKRKERNDRPSDSSGEPGKRRERRDRKEKNDGDMRMETFRIAVGRTDGVTPRQIVGAIANEAGLDGDHIGHIKIHDIYSTVDLPLGMPKEVFQILQKTRVCNRPLRIEKYQAKGRGRDGKKSKRPPKE